MHSWNNVWLATPPILMSLSLPFQCSVLSTCSALYALTEPQTSLVFCMDYGRKYNFGIYCARNALRNVESFRYCSRFKRKVLRNSIIFVRLHNFIRLLMNIFCEALMFNYVK